MTLKETVKETVKETLSSISSGLFSTLDSAIKLPVTAIKLSLENVVVKELAKYLSQFLGVVGVSLDGSILLSISFCLVAVISYWLVDWLTTLLSSLLPSDNKGSEESSSADGDCWCDDELCCDDDILCCDLPCELH